MTPDDYKLLYTSLVEQIEESHRTLSKPAYLGYPAGVALGELLRFKDGCLEGLGE